MKQYPSIYDVFDMDFPEKFMQPFDFQGMKHLMKTDIREKDGNIYLDVELPGFKKEDVTISLKNGYLSVSANHQENKEEKDEHGKWIRCERSKGSCSRSYFVGEYVKPQDVHASYDNGILELSFPSTDKELEEKTHTILID